MPSPSPQTKPIEELAAAWRSLVAPPRRRVSAAGFALLAVFAFLGARYGTDRARLGAGLLLLGGAIGAVAWWGAGRFRLREPSAILRRLVWHVDRARAERALRALAFIEPGRPRRRHV